MKRQARPHRLAFRASACLEQFLALQARNSHFFMYSTPQNFVDVCCCQLAFVLGKGNPRVGLHAVGSEAAYTRQASSRTHPITQVTGSTVDTLDSPTTNSPVKARPPLLHLSSASSRLRERPLHGTTAGCAWRLRPRDSADLPRRSRLRTAVV